MNEQPHKAMEGGRKPASYTDFDWSADVALPERCATAIYLNTDRELVIRQRRWPDDDVVVIVSEACTQPFIDRVADVLGIGAAGGRERGT